jgi:hypothetical protein
MCVDDDGEIKAVVEVEESETVLEASVVVVDELGVE